MNTTRHTARPSESASSALGSLIGMLLVGAVLGPEAMVRTTTTVTKTPVDLGPIDDLMKAVAATKPDDFGISIAIGDDEDQVRAKYTEYVRFAVAHAQAFLQSDAPSWEKNSLTRRLSRPGLADSLKRIIETHVRNRKWNRTPAEDFMFAVNYELFFARNLPVIK